MNKSSQYNQQQTESKQCNSEGEELRIHQNHLKINTVGSMLEREFL